MNCKYYFIKAVILFMLSPLTQGLAQEQSPSALKEMESARATGQFLNREWNEAPEGLLKEEISISSNVQSYEADFATYISSDHKLEQADLLLNAYKGNPSDKDLWPYVLVHYGMSGDQESLKEMAMNIKNAHLIPEAQMELHRLLISELDDNDVLISHGLWDTATLLSIQAETDNRVPIISLEWLKDQDFRSKKLPDMGVVAPDIKTTASKTLMDLQKNNPNLDIHLTLSQNKHLLNALANALSLNGLTLSLSVKEDASADLLHTWYTLKSTKPSDKAFASTYSPWHRNYLPLLMSIEAYSLKNGQGEDAALSRKWMNDITDGLGVSRIPKP
jgi:hypothetical protein